MSQNIHWNKQQTVILFLYVVTICVIGIIVGLQLQESKQVVQEEAIGQQVADDYLAALLKQTELENQPLVGSDVEPGVEYDDKYNFEDDIIYRNYGKISPRGRVDCVIEIPKIELRQCVYTGTLDEIEYDLSKWRFVTARIDYMLGTTHYCIYAHNAFDGSLKISKAQSELRIGDSIVVTSQNGVYLYQISCLSTALASECETKYINNAGIPSDTLYIFTCATGSDKGKNLVIEGKIQKVYSLQEWSARNRIENEK